MTNKKISCCEMCCRIWKWFWQLSLCFAFFLLIISFLFQDQLLTECSVFIGFISYIIYLINSLCSTTCGYLYNMEKAESIHDYMKNMFCTPVKMTFYIICYHFEDRKYTSTNEKGEKETKIRTELVTTYRTSQEFHYYSWRDVSGLFLLDSHKVMTTRKHFIKLELELNVKFVDEDTTLEYERQKRRFINKYKSLDEYYEFSENTTLSGFTKYKMVKISDSPLPFVNLCWYLFFTFIIPLVEFYKMYINQFCIHQNYTIKKIISATYNLNSSKYLEKYKHRTPKIVIYEKVMVYNEAHSDFKHSSNSLPYEEELQNSRSYSKILSNSSSRSNLVSLPSQNDLVSVSSSSSASRNNLYTSKSNTRQHNSTSYDNVKTKHYLYGTSYPNY